MSKRENFPDKQKYSTHQGKSTNSSTSLDRATEILACIGNEINTITDIAGYLRYSTSTVHRLLQTLRRLNWVVLDDNNHKFYLGPMLTQLSSDRIAAHKYLIMHALREMVRLADITEETINLGVMVQMHFTLLHEISSSHNLRITAESKRLGQQYNGATAKVLISQLGREEMRTALKQLKLEQVTENTVTDKGILAKQLEEVKRQGYCLSRGERIPGAVCISVPIKQYICPACLSVVGPESRLGPKEGNVIKELKASAGRVSSDIATAFN